MNGADYTNEKVQLIATQCLSVRMRLLNRMVNSIYDTALRPHQVKASQMNILVAVAFSGMTTSMELCQLLQMDTSTFSRALTRLRSNQWLVTEPSGDGKILNIVISKGGLNKIEEVFPEWKQAQNEVAELLGDSATKAILEIGTKHLGK